MKLNINFKQSKEEIDVGFNANNQRINLGFKDTQQITTSDYEKLNKKPRIENVELVGDKTFEDLGLEEITNQEILDIANKILYGGSNG